MKLATQIVEATGGAVTAQDLLAVTDVIDSSANAPRYVLGRGFSSNSARRFEAVIDWSECSLVQRDPDYVSGQPALKADPRVTVDGLVESADYGTSPAEISTAYGVPAETISTLLDCAKKHRVSSPAP